MDSANRWFCRLARISHKPIPPSASLRIPPWVVHAGFVASYWFVPREGEAAAVPGPSPVTSGSYSPSAAVLRSWIMARR